MKSNNWKSETNLYDRSNMDMSRLFKGVSEEDGFSKLEVREIEKEALALINLGWGYAQAVKRAIAGTLSARTYYSTVLHCQLPFKKINSSVSPAITSTGTLKNIS